MMKMSKIFLCIIICSLTISLVGCATSSKSSSPSGAGHKLRIDLANEPATLDPGLQYNTDSYSVYRNIFDNLLRRDPKTLEIVPWVAESWKQESPTMWTFVIRDGIKFHNGEKLTAEDVAFSIERILDKSLRSPQYSNYSQILSVQASGNIVKITTDGPSPTLLAQLVNLSIVPAKYVKERGNEYFNLNPIGSGAYVFTEWRKGSQIVLDINKDYWQAKANITSAIFRFVPNAASRVADLQSNQADIILALNADDIEVLNNNKNVQIFSSPTERVAFLQFNCLGTGASQLVNVRKAMAYGIDTQSIIRSLLKGYGNPVKELSTPLAFGYISDIEGYSYNPEKARALLKEAGYDELTVEFPTSPAYDQRIVQAIQGDLAKIGIKVKIVSTDQATFLKKVQSPKHDWGEIRFGIWSSGTLDVHGTIYPLFHSGTVWNSFSNAEFDAAIETAARTTDANVRIQSYKTAFSILQDEVPGMGLWQTHSISAASKHLVWQPDAQENFFIRDMKWVD